MRGRTLFIAGLLTAAFAGQAAAQTTVVGSPHDLSATTTGDNAEICVYCHTPHGAKNEQGPLWNKPLNPQTYTAYDSTTIDGSIIGTTTDLTVASVSIACLTCHDGTQAMDSVINAPGTGTGGMVSSGNTMSSVANTFANIGIDLSNDHPIAIQYGGFEVAGVQIDPDFENLAGKLETAEINGTDVWWIETGVTPDVRNKTDLILYTRDYLGSDQPFVECATCHDPHAGDVSLTAEVNFLRISNTGSNLCLACHIK